MTEIKTTKIKLSEKGAAKLEKMLKKKKERQNKLKENYSRMLEEGHIELVDYDIDTPLKVQKAIGVTQEGKDFLNGK